MSQFSAMKHVLGFLVARLFAKLGENFLRFCIPLLAYEMTHSVASAGLAFTCQWLPRLLLLPIGGVVVDRLGSLRSYLLFEGARAAFLFIGAAAFKLGILPGIIVVYLVGAATSCSGAVVFISLEKAIAERLTKAARGAVHSAVQTIEQVTLVAAPALGGLTTYFGNGFLALLFTAVLFSISVLCAFYDGKQDPMTPASGVERPPLCWRQILAEMSEGWRAVVSSRMLLRLVAATSLVNLVSGVVMATVAPIAKGTWNVDDLTYGAYTAGAGIFTILVVSAGALIRSEQQSRWVFFISLIVVGVAGFLQGVVGNAPLFFLFYTLMVTACGTFAAAMRTLRTSLLPPALLGRSLSFMMLLNQATIPLSGIIVSTLGSIMNPQAIVLAQSSLMMVTLIVVGSFDLGLGRKLLRSKSIKVMQEVQK